MATIGCDPEFFVREIETQEIVPGCGLIGGSKANPDPLYGLPEGFGVQEDNVMAELTIPPARGAGIFAESVQLGKAAINARLSGTGHELVEGRSEYMFSRDALRKHGAAGDFGCSPDFDAYTQGNQRATLTARMMGNRRFCGGHIHLGGKFRAPEWVSAMICDATLGTLSIAQGDVQRYRRRLYGVPGVYRPTSYGIEYRVMSNYWTTNDGFLNEVSDVAWQVAEFLERDAKDIRELHLLMNWGVIRSAIQNSNVDQCAELHYQAMQVVRGTP